MRAVLDMAAGSHRGRVRPHNEDCFAASTGLGLAILADGMGGHQAGEVASRMAVDVIGAGIHAALRASPRPSIESASAESLLVDQIALANARILEAGSARADFAGMGSTVVVALWHDGAVTVGHVGDSRLYRLRARELEQLTHDHSLAQEQIDRGRLSPEDARAAGLRNVLTRTLGNAGEVIAELNTFEVAGGDLYLLCSDGLTDMLSDAQIRDALLSVGGEIQGAVDRLIHEANEKGGLDNISVIVARVVNRGDAA